MEPVRYRPRLVDSSLRTLAARFAAIMINGPRASGKTTSASRVAAEVMRLDEPARAAVARADPDAALRAREKPLLIDEWQEVPEILGAVKRAVDQDRTPGQFILTGSVRAPIENRMWPGTGRIIRVSMYGLTEHEVVGAVDEDEPGFLDRLVDVDPVALPLPHMVPDVLGYVAVALRGSFPEIALWPTDDEDRRTWLATYVDELISRDAHFVRAGSDERKLRRYFNALALNTAGIPSDKTLYDSAGVSAVTAQAYDDLLDGLYVTDHVPAWTTRRLVRLAKATKRYVVDPALAASAAGYTARSVLEDGDLLGRVIDTFCVAQLRPEVALSAGRIQLHHLRVDGGRHEVDLVVEYDDGRVAGLEFKATAAPTRADVAHLQWLRQRIGDRFAVGALMHTGPEVFQLDDRILAVPICALWG